VVRNPQQRLQIVLQVTKVIQDNYSRPQLLQFLEHVLKYHLGVPGFAVYSVRNGQPHLEYDTVNMAQQLETLPLQDFLNRLEPDQDFMKFSSDEVWPFDLVVPVFHKTTLLAALLLQNAAEMDSEDVDFVLSLANILYVSFENKLMAREYARQRSEQAALNRQLEVAAALQRQLFPEEMSSGGGVEVDGFFRTHAEVGGDYYDFFPVPTHQYMMCMADVSGKGVDAAFLMSNFQANFRTLSMYETDLIVMAKILNEKVNALAKGEKFITCFLGRYNTATRELDFLNCGHNAPILISQGQVHLLKAGTVGLGMLDELPAATKGSMVLTEQDLLVCYTDGATDLESPEGQRFGEAALLDLISENANLSIKDINALVVRKLEQFRQEYPYRDDIAFLACRFN
jgi:sigma-B regulation protein RsbU (phosphoserine phosphatase)